MIVKVKAAHSCLTLCDLRTIRPWNSLCQNTGVGSLSLLQGIFPTHRLNPGLLHCRWILYQLSHKGSPRMLKWAAYPFPMETSQHRNRTRVSYIAKGLFPNWVISLKYTVSKFLSLNHHLNMLPLWMLPFTHYFLPGPLKSLFPGVWWVFTGSLLWLMLFHSPGWPSWPSVTQSSSNTYEIFFTSIKQGNLCV